MDCEQASLRQRIRQCLEDVEDARLGAAALERFRSGEEKTYSLDQVMAELDQED